MFAYMDIKMVAYSCFKVLEVVLNFFVQIYEIPNALRHNILATVFDDNYSVFGVVTHDGTVVRFHDYENRCMFYYIYLAIANHFGFFEMHHSPICDFTTNICVKYYFWTYYLDGKKHTVITKNIIDATSEDSPSNLVYAVINDEIDITRAVKSYMGSIRALDDLSLETFLKIIALPNKIDIQSCCVKTMNSDTWEEKTIYHDDILRI